MAIKGLAARALRLLAGTAFALGPVHPALAADKLEIAPPAKWVTAVAVPADDGKGADAPVRMLLSDQQVDLTPGHVTRYVETVFKVQTPQGLGAGAVSITWNPDLEQATIHKLLIRRGTQVIDVLAAGQSFTVIRRETNLDNAVLDGQLTGSIQPEGLQVGDVVDFAASITTSDPAVGAHVEQIGAAWNALPMARAHFRARWPAAVTMQVQPNGGLQKPRIETHGGESEVALGVDDLKPAPGPKGAPARFQYGRFLEMSDASGWADLARLMLPLYTKAEALPAGAKISAEIARIKAASNDPRARAEAALALVQDRVRYVFLGMNDGGLVPADAETTWSRRFGDCKGKTALLLALLHGLDIDAHPVLVSSKLGEGLDKRLPEIALFDHVLVAAAIGGKTYWLDGTRTGDTSLDGIDTPPFHWGLPLTASAAALVPIEPAPYTTPHIEVAIHIDASQGLTIPAKIHIDRTIRGDEAVLTNLALANLAGEMRDKGLRQFWKDNYDFAEPQAVTSSYDAAHRTLKLSLDGTTKMDWSEGAYEADHVWVGYKADFSRDPGTDQAAPFAVAFPSYTKVTETIVLPPSPTAFRVRPGSDVDQTVAGIEYHRHAKIDGSTFVVEESECAIAPEFPAAEAPAAETTLRALAKKAVHIEPPAVFTKTTAEQTAAAATPGSTVAAMLARAEGMAALRHSAEALAEVDKAIAADPKSAVARVYRAQLELASGNRAAAHADLDRAIALDAHEPRVVWATATFAQLENRDSDGIAALTEMLGIKPGNAMVLMMRARLYQRTGKFDLALADADAALTILPDQPEMRLLRAKLLAAQGDVSGATREADLMMEKAGTSTSALVSVAELYAAIGRNDAAVKALDTVLATRPEPYFYLKRYEVRARRDIAGRRADLDSALKLSPTFGDALTARAKMQVEQGEWRAAIATLNPLIATAPLDPELLGQRGIAHARQGETALAIRDFTAARAKARTAKALNALCWSKATANVALARALEECEAAMALAPDAAQVADSRAFVLLRLGRLDDAIGQYDKALARAPRLPASLYGRALAEERKGDHAAARRDAEAALKLSAAVKDEFDGFGMTLPAA